jgi:ParB/RepB/Spo0J family partition protein
MTSVSGTPRSEPLEAIATSLGRVRYPQPSRIERLQQSLARHGQLSPVIVVRRQGRLELVDGFKRRRAAERLGWTTLLVVEAPLDETAQWATMLWINCRGAQSMSEIEEALVLRELVGTGLTQVEIAALLERHKSWVSRRIGLIERLHPELLEAIRLGMLHPGVARRLLSLPPGNQLRVAAAVQQAGLGPRDTEWLVGLWHQAPSETQRCELLRDPRSSLARHHYPQIPATDRQGPSRPAHQRMYRLLGVLMGTAARMIAVLGPAPLSQEMIPLGPAIATAAQTLHTLADQLGSCSRTAPTASGAASSGTG